MESMEGMLQKLRLSEAEKKEIEIGEMKMAEGSTNHAIGKLLSERLTHLEAIERALGRVWCSIGGIECKGLGDNKFLFTFNQSSGKRRAIEGRPWMFSNELLVMMELEEEKSIAELEFIHIPIWIRVSNLPIGLMNREAGELIGNEVGVFLEVEKDNGDVALGKFMRIKIRLDIRKPLMRGVTVKVGKEGREKWCPIVYEYLPDFCYICGVIEHNDKHYDIKLAKGEKPLFDKGLRWIPSRSLGEVDGRGRKAPRYSYRQGLLEAHHGKGDDGSREGMLVSRSDVPSWKKYVVGSPSKIKALEAQQTAREQCHARSAVVENKKDGEKKEERNSAEILTEGEMGQVDTSNTLIQSQQMEITGNSSTLTSPAAVIREQGKLKRKNIQKNPYGSKSSKKPLDEMLGTGKRNRVTSDMEVDPVEEMGKRLRKEHGETKEVEATSESR